MEVVDLTEEPTKLDRDVRKRVEKAIARDKWGKVEKMVERGEVGVDTVVGKKGETMLHLAAKEEAEECMEGLLEMNANAKLVDKKGNLPLHIALNMVIDDYSRSSEKRLVQGLLARSLDCLGQRNRDGFTVRELLVSLDKARERKEEGKRLAKASTMQSNLARVRKEEEERPQSEEEAWRERLAWECEDEYQGSQGRWEEEEGWREEERETYDEWADRIFRAFSAKRRPPPVQRKEEGPQAPRKTLRPEFDIAQMEEKSRLLRERKKKEKEARLCFKLWESDDPITPNGIPFQGMEDVTILDIMLELVKDSGAEDVKKKIREELRRWHPDKFWQKMSHRVALEDKEDVMERVKRVSQALTNFGK